MHPAILQPAAARRRWGSYFRRAQACRATPGEAGGPSGPPIVISKYSPASARTSSIAPLCPPAPPALGREFRFQKAMMALAPAEIPPISDSMKLNCDSYGRTSEWTDGGTGAQTMHAQHTRTTTSTQVKSKPPKIQRRKPAEDQDVQGYP